MPRLAARPDGQELCDDAQGDLLRAVGAEIETYGSEHPIALRRADLLEDIPRARSRAEDADIPRSLLDLAGEEAALKAALETTARVLQLSLFDYI